MIALQGVLLFLFVPLVLFLLLRQPAGPGLSVAIGLAIMFGHRFAAAPWMATFAEVRCLWCGRVGAGQPLPVVAGGREWRMTACSGHHATLVQRFLRFVFRFRVAIGLGIFLPLAWLVAASLAAAIGRPLLAREVNASIFRVAVAGTVVAASILPFLPARAGRSAGASPPGEPCRCPFPLHNLFLLGVRNTLWIFRIVGAWWLADGVLRLATKT